MARLVAGCEGKDVEFGSGVNAVGWDYVFWQTQSGAEQPAGRRPPRDRADNSRGL